MDKTIGQITIVVIGMVAFASGAIAVDLQGIARIGVGGWNGFIRSGTEVEAIVCNARGNCRVRPGSEGGE
jgi:O-acetyl-ADP-ribose deacetylase (regulator of RNase III)